MTDETSDMERSRRLARRRMAWTSFAAIMIEAAVMLTGVFIGDSLFANNVRAASSILIGLFWAQAALVGAYLGVSLTEALKK